MLWDTEYPTTPTKKPLTRTDGFDIAKGVSYAEERRVQEPDGIEGC